MIFEENITREKDGKKYTDNIERGKIFCDDEIIREYCILGVNEDTVLIRNGITISQIPITDDLAELVAIFTSENKTSKPKEKPSKKTKKEEDGK